MARSRRIRPGHFETTLFQPAFRAVVPQGWRGWEYADATMLFLGDATCELTLDATDYNPATADGLIRTLRGTPGLEATEVAEVEVAGLPALTFDADVVEEATLNDNSGMTLDAGDRLRAVALAHPQQAISVFLFAPAKDFERVVAEADEILRTLRFVA